MKNEQNGSATAMIPDNACEGFHSVRVDSKYIIPFTVAPMSGSNGISHMSVGMETCCKSDSTILTLQFLPCGHPHTTGVAEGRNHDTQAHRSFGGGDNKDKEDGNLPMQIAAVA